MVLPVILIRLDDFGSEQSTKGHSSAPPFSLERHRFDLNLSVPIQRLICFVRLYPVGYSIPFLVPIVLSVHIPLGFCFEPVSWNAPVTHYGFSYLPFLLNHTDCDFSQPYISIWHCYRPVPSQFSSVLLGHSNHGHFIDPRPVGGTIHLWTAFVVLFHTATLRPLSAFVSLLSTPPFTGDAVCSREGVSGRYPFIPPFGLSVLLIKDFVLL